MLRLIRCSFIKSYPLVLAAAMLFFASGCGEAKHSATGFRLPDGDAEAGQRAFIEMNCIRCHSVEGAPDTQDFVAEREIHIVLGGRVTRVKTYGQLVTSIINPSHVISSENREKHVDEHGNSLMPDMTEDLSVRQMIDLVAFLQSHYDVEAPAPAYEDLYYGL